MKRRPGHRHAGAREGTDPAQSGYSGSGREPSSASRASTSKRRRSRAECRKSPSGRLFATVAGGDDRDVIYIVKASAGDGASRLRIQAEGGRNLGSLPG